MGQHFRVRKGTFIRRADARGMGAALKTRSSLPAVHAGFEREGRCHVGETRAAVITASIQIVARDEIVGSVSSSAKVPCSAE